MNRPTVMGLTPTRAAIETLAIISYHQPVTRSEVEEIRGVGVSKGSFDLLLEAGWIRPVGRRRTPGRPVTGGTSEKFLEQFGLISLADLPGIDELKASGLLDTRPASSIVSSGAGHMNGASALPAATSSTATSPSTSSCCEGASGAPRCAAGRPAATPRTATS